MILYGMQTAQWQRGQQTVAGFGGQCCSRSAGRFSVARQAAAGRRRQELGPPESKQTGGTPSCPRPFHSSRSKQLTSFPSDNFCNAPLSALASTSTKRERERERLKEEGRRRAPPRLATRLLLYEMSPPRRRSARLASVSKVNKQPHLGSRRFCRRHCPCRLC